MVADDNNLFLFINFLADRSFEILHNTAFCTRGLSELQSIVNALFVPKYKELRKSDGKLG